LYFGKGLRRPCKPFLKESIDLPRSEWSFMKCNFLCFCGRAYPGVDVMITIFCDFCQFSAEKMGFFSKTNVMMTIFAKTNSSLGKKRKNCR
jgi:hypothetical protein